MTKEEYTGTLIAGNVKEEISYLRDVNTANWIPQRKRDYLSHADSLLSQVFTVEHLARWKIFDPRGVPSYLDDNDPLYYSDEDRP